MSQPDATRQTASSSTRRGAGALHREVQGDIRSVRVSSDGRTLAITASDGRFRSIMIWVMLIFAGFSVFGLVMSRGNVLAALPGAVTVAAAAVAVAVIRRRACFARETDDAVRFKMSGRPPQVLPRPAVCVQVFGPLTGFSRGSTTAADAAVSTLASLVSLPFGYLVVQTHGKDAVPGPEIHVVLEGMGGRVRFWHAAAQRKIFSRSARIAEFLRVPLENRTGVGPQPAESKDRKP
jgi:hypothetical protein